MKMQRTTFIIPSIRVFDLWKEYLQNFDKFGHDTSKIDVLFIDEGDDATRLKTREIFSETNFEFFGPAEREKFFKDNFGNDWQRYLEVIPKRAHAETSFGMLLALQRKPDLVIEVDDDTAPYMSHDFLGMHSKVVGRDVDKVIHSTSGWYNVMENLESVRMENEEEVPVSELLHPRGFPYAKRFVETNYIEKRPEEGNGRVVMNEGLWFQVPDFDAVNILAEGGVDGHPRTRSKSLKNRTVVLEKGTQVTVCSMNVAFDKKVIPAFYQMPMKYMNIDRFDDIWSGILVKKAIDAMGDYIALGEPCVIHKKAKRSSFKDLRAEMDGMVVNESLARMLAEIPLDRIDNSSYNQAYRSITENLQKMTTSDVSMEPWMKDYLGYVFKMMDTWSDICEKLV